MAKVPTPIAAKAGISPAEVPTPIKSQAAKAARTLAATMAIRNVLRLIPGTAGKVSSLGRPTIQASGIGTSGAGELSCSTGL
jgi:hypothetical protein